MGIAGLWGTEVPQRGPGRSPAGVTLGAKPQKPDICTEFAAVKRFSTQVYCRVRPPSPLPPKNSSDLRKFHDSTRPGQGWHVPTRCYPGGREAVLFIVTINSSIHATTAISVMTLTDSNNALSKVYPGNVQGAALAPLPLLDELVSMLCFIDKATSPHRRMP